MKKSKIFKSLAVFGACALAPLMFTGCKTDNTTNATNDAEIRAVYALAVDNGYTGTYEEWLNSIKGKDGLTPYIGTNNHWWIGTTDTGVLAQGQNGQDGKTPYIGENGDWWIGTTDTGVIAEYKETTFTVTFDYGKAKYFFDEIGDSISVGYGKWIENLPEISNNIEMHDAFLGWYIKGSDIKFNPNTEIKGNIELYAKFDVTSNFAQAGLYQNGKFIKTWSEIEEQYPQAFDGDKIKNIGRLQGTYPFGHFLGLTGELVMPDNITYIGEFSFSHSYLSFVKFGKNVRYVGQLAFNCCYRLTNIILNDGINYMGSYAFSYCDALNFNKYDNAYYLGSLKNPYCALIKTISYNIVSCEINDNCNVIQDRAFDNCSYIESFNEFGNGYYLGSTERPCMALIDIKSEGNHLEISKFCIYIGGNIFSHDNFIDTIGPDNHYISNRFTVKDNTIYDYDGSQYILIFGCKNSNIDTYTDIIGEDALYYSGIEEIIIPIHVKEIRPFAFSVNLSKVFYRGTEEQWNEIVINENNNALNNATRYYYSETEPTIEGNFWHYDTDGVTPVIWEAE